MTARRFLQAVVAISLAASARTIAQEAAHSSSLIRVQRHSTPAWVLEDRGMLGERRPGLRGFRARILDHAATWNEDGVWPMSMPGAEHTHPVWISADLVSRRLARDGLLVTLAEAIQPWLAEDAKEYRKAFERSRLGWLRSAGVPVDWLAYFAPPGGEVSGPEALVESIERQLDSGATIDSMRANFAKVPYEFRASVPGFRACTDSGDDDIGLVRVQLVSGDYWSGIGDGGSVDLVRQLVTLLPDARFVASIEDKHVARFLETAADWPIGRADRFTLAPESLPVAQWAQDNAKVGVIAPANGGEGQIVTLVPRYASRGEDGATFVPGETFLIEGFAATGQRVVQSPLLFQGGDLIVARHPRTGERTLLVGEAEVYRNTALGLAREQVLDAFRIELGADRVVVLPAASFHIDYEVSVRAVRGELVAFVPDTPAAARIAFDCGLGALEQHGRLDHAAALSARENLAQAHVHEAVEIASRALVPAMRGPGRFDESLARDLSVSAADSGVGNLQTFLLALDLLESEVASSRSGALDPNTAAYLDSFRRRDADRARIAKTLADLGWTIVRVPTFSDGERGINHLNGMHARGLFLMPAHGGLYERLDRAAADAFGAALERDVKVIPVVTSESQRRSGAVRCSVSVSPRS
jgi:hypothetical protein